MQYQCYYYFVLKYHFTFQKSSKRTWKVLAGFLSARMGWGWASPLDWTTKLVLFCVLFVQWSVFPWVSF